MSLEALMAAMWSFLAVVPAFSSSRSTWRLATPALTCDCCTRVDGTEDGERMVARRPSSASVRYRLSLVCTAEPGGLHVLAFLADSCSCKKCACLHVPYLVFTQPFRNSTPPDPSPFRPSGEKGAIGPRHIQALPSYLLFCFNPFGAGRP